MQTKYESDLTKQEKRQLEREKLSKMNFPQKVDYIWTYYKILLFIPLAIFAAVYFGYHIYLSSHENVLLNVAIVGGNSLAQNQILNLESDIGELLGAEGKFDVVRVQASIPENTTSDVNGNMALTTLIGADAIDVLICPKATYNDYKKQNGFKDGALLYKNSGFILDSFGVLYDDVYIAVLSNVRHSEAAQTFMEYVESHAEQENALK